MIYIAIFLLGCLSYYLLQRVRLGKFEMLAKEIIEQAEAIAQKKELEQKEQQLQQSKEFEKSWQEENRKLIREEEKLEQRALSLEKKFSDLEKKEGQLQASRELLEKELTQAKKNGEQFKEQLEKLAGISSQEARTLLLKKMEEEVKADSAKLIKRCQEEAILQAETEATRVIATAISRMATSTTSEIATCTVALPNEEMKGRIIGREGRNIRSFERATGVTLIMDDTPQAIVISGFDPVRRNVAKIALTELILDGRIHPTTIEEAVEKAIKTTDKQIQTYGEDAAFRIGAMDLHPELITLLGKLKFRYSIAQNVLEHSIEVAYLMGIMASELGLDVPLAKRIGLLHDIGKAVSHEVRGSHALIGQTLALNYGETEKCANGIGCHHLEIAPTTVEACLIHAADTISASRPGARMEAPHVYVQRLKQLEDMALSFPGVEKAYAVQAGRELRVITIPEQVNDVEMTLLAKNLTDRIQKELHYSGKIKVTVLREKRAIEYAM